LKTGSEVWACPDEEAFTDRSTTSGITGQESLNKREVSLTHVLVIGVGGGFINRTNDRVEFG
jgi:hypothetical protein